VHHIVELLSLLQAAKVASKLSMDMRGLQVFILFHVLYHHSDVILTAIRRGWSLGSTDNAA